MTERILIAGASGALGLEVTRLLADAGYALRTVSQSRGGAAKLAPWTADTRVVDAVDGDLSGLCNDVDLVFSCLGASVSPSAPERRSYFAVDTRANLRLIEEAKRAGVRRFVYVAVAGGPGYDQTRYVRAHEAVVDALKVSGMEYSVVRPTGFFSAMEEFLDMARQGIMPLFNGGHAKSNPIHTLDLAAVCVRALREAPGEYPAGGPEVFTRRQIGEAAFRAVGRKPRFVWAPARAVLLLVPLIRLFHPRLGELMEFVARVSIHDATAPVAGTRTLQAHFDAVARGRSSDLGRRTPV